MPKQFPVIWSRCARGFGVVGMGAVLGLGGGAAWSADWEALATPGVVLERFGGSVVTPDGALVLAGEDALGAGYFELDVAEGGGAVRLSDPLRAGRRLTGLYGDATGSTLVYIDGDASRGALAEVWSMDRDPGTADVRVSGAAGPEDGPAFVVANGLVREGEVLFSRELVGTAVGSLSGRVFGASLDGSSGAVGLTPVAGPGSELLSEVVSPDGGRLVYRFGDGSVDRSYFGLALDGLVGGGDGAAEVLVTGGPLVPASGGFGPAGFSVVQYDTLDGATWALPTGEGGEPVKVRDRAAFGGEARAVSERSAFYLNRASPVGSFDLYGVSLTDGSAAVLLGGGFDGRILGSDAAGESVFVSESGGDAVVAVGIDGSRREVGRLPAGVFFSTVEAGAVAEPGDESLVLVRSAVSGDPPMTRRGEVFFGGERVSGLPSGQFLLGWDFGVPGEGLVALADPVDASRVQTYLIDATGVATALGGVVLDEGDSGVAGRGFSLRRVGDYALVFGVTEPGGSAGFARLLVPEPGLVLSGLGGMALFVLRSRRG